MNGPQGGAWVTRMYDDEQVPPVFSPLTRTTSLRRAFTLVELLVVVAIIGILAGLVLGIAGYASQKADRGRAITDLEKIKNALDEYRIVYGTFPQNTASSDSRKLAQALWSTPQTGEIRRAPFLAWKGWQDPTVTTNRLTDPWGNDYRYYYDADGNPNYSPNNNSKLTYDLWSVGPSAALADDDITNWKGDF